MASTSPVTTIGILNFYLLLEYINIIYACTIYSFLGATFIPTKMRNLASISPNRCQFVIID